MKYDNSKDLIINCLPEKADKEPTWLKYAPTSKREIYRKNLENKKLFELRKQLFNGVKSPKKSISYKNEPGLEKLRQVFSFEKPNPSLERLMKQCQVKIDYWLREQKKPKSLSVS